MPGKGLKSELKGLDSEFKCKKSTGYSKYIKYFMLTSNKKGNTEKMLSGYEYLPTPCKTYPRQRRKIIVTRK